MDFRILGRLEALDGGRDVAPQRAKQRALLALLLLHPNQRVSTDRIIEALWGEEPPNTSEKALQGHVSALRKLLSSSRIRTERGAYRLEVRPGELDVDRFASTLAEARSTSDPQARARLLSEALSIWRGDALADVADERFAEPEIDRLEALRLAAVEDRAEAQLELGQHAAVIPELELLVGRHPLHEGLRARLMLALYRAGRQADALRVYRDARRHLAEELGIDPGTELQLLERQILAQNPALAAPAAKAPASARPRQERKTVTLLVLEVTAAAPIDPEDLERLTRPTIDGVRAIVERLGGSTEPLFANALLLTFGAPRAHDDDPLRAVRAALELRPAAGDPVLLRGGMETGEALVTIDGERVAVTGEVLAAAARLQAVAPAGSIVIGPRTHQATGTLIEYREAGPAAWTAERLRAAQAAAPDIPFVGRAEELGLLERIYRRACDEQAVQLVTLTAEPGGGKSRLLRELRTKLEALETPPTWRQGTCLPYGDGVTYWALGEVVKTHAGILESDDSLASAAKLRAAVDDLEADETRRAWLDRGLRALVGIEQTSASGDREQAFAVWRHAIEGIAARSALVLAFEDIHWADEAFLAFIDDLVTRASGISLLVVCTARLELLEAHPGWAGGKRNATALALEPLSTVETEELLHALLGRAPEPATIRQAGGNPLFAHELARFVEASPSGGSAAIPESLQAVIAAHLDTLAPELKVVASDAAVLGEVFWTGAVASMGDLDEREVETRLQRLVANDVARRRRPSSVARQSEYAFLHVLVRDVAYWQIPRRDRIAKHRSAGEWIERLAGDRVTNHAELIAHHYGQALEIARSIGADADVSELKPRAREFLALAGEGARMVEMAQAESFYRGALELSDEGDVQHGRLLSRLGEIAHHTGRLEEAERLGENAIAELRMRGDLLGAGEAMVTRAITLWRLGRPEQERRGVAAEAIRTLEQVPPGRELVLAYAQMATHELHAGRARACGEWAQKALALADRLGLAALKVKPLHHLGIARFESGDEAGIDDIREAVRLGRETGLSLETGTAHTNLAATIWVTEGPVQALAVKGDAADFALSRGLSSLERTIRAESLWQQFDAGAWDDALASADRIIGEQGDHGPSRVTTMARTVKARILAERDRTREAADVESEYLARARELSDPQDLGPALAAGAALRQALGDLAGAAALIAELERVTRGRDPSQRVHELPHAARVCLASGTLPVAQALIPTRGAPTYTRARLCLGSAGAILAEGRGEPAAAAELHAAAADGWRAFGCPAEEAHALIGQGRCLAALGQHVEAARSVRRARRIGRSLRAVVLLREADRVLSPT